LQGNNKGSRLLNNPTNQTPDAETNVGFLGANKHQTIMKTIKQFLLDNAGPIFFTIAMSIGLFLMGLLLGAIDQWLLPDLPIQYR